MNGTLFTRTKGCRYMSATVGTLVLNLFYCVKVKFKQKEKSKKKFNTVKEVVPFCEGNFLCLIFVCCLDNEECSIDLSALTPLLDFQTPEHVIMC